MNGSVHLLGSVHAVLESGSVLFAPDKRHVLLGILALQSGGASREWLATLFWPNADPLTAHQNLRRLLFRTRALPWLRGLDVTASTVAWPVETDVRLFLSEAERRDPHALTRYDGDLLESLASALPDQVDAFVRPERERLRDLRRSLALEHAARLDRAGRSHEALALLRPLLHDAFDDDAIACFLTAARHAGLPHVALEAYDRYAQQLDDALHVHPPAALRDAASSLRADLTTPWVDPDRPSDLSQGGEAGESPSSFVGRELEFAAVTSLLRDTARLVSIVGPGGVGKTVFAQRVMSALEAQMQGVFVALESARTERDVLVAIARALKAPLAGASLQDLQRELASKKVLLVLDNAEHLTGNLTLLTDLLACPGVRMLVTSRSPLNVQAETPYRLDGLAFPPTVERWDDAYDAVQLFQQRARRAEPQFRVTPADRGHVQQLCALLGGLPLALELAATWVPFMTLAEIVDVVRHDPGELQADLRDLPERHRSVRVVLQHTWALLSSDEQRALRALGAVGVAFDLTTATTIAQADRAALLRLHAKGLLRRNADGRLILHPLVRHLAEQQASKAAPEAEAVRARHARHYANFLACRSRVTDDAAMQVRHLDEIEAELDHIEAAWAWMTSRRAHDLIDACLDSLWWYYELRGDHATGIVAFGAAAAALPKGSTLGRTLVRLGICHLRVGDMPEQQRGRTAELAAARAALTRGLRLLGDAAEAHIHDVLLGYLHLGVVIEAQGNPRRARVLFEVGRREARRVGHALSIRAFTTRLALNHQLLGAYREAERLHLERLRNDELLQDVHGLAICTGYLGGLMLLDGRPDEAGGYFKRAVEYWTRLKKVQALPWLVRHQGDAAYLQGRYSEATQHFRDSSEAYASSGHHDLAWHSRVRALHATFRVHGSHGLASEADSLAALVNESTPAWITFELQTLLALVIEPHDPDAALALLRARVPWTWPRLAATVFTECVAALAPADPDFPFGGLDWREVWRGASTSD